MKTPQPDSPFLRAQLARIWGGTVGLMVALAVLFAAYGVLDYRAQFALAESEAQEIADMAALNAEATLQAANQLLTGMGAILQHAPEAATPQAPQIRNTLLSWQAGTPYLMDLLVVEPPGRILHWTGPGTPPDVSDRQYVRHHLEAPDSRLYVGEPQMSKVHPDKWFFGVSKPLRDKAGKVDRVVVAAIDLSVFGDSLGVRFSIPGSTLVIASGDGKIYARIPDNEKYVGKHPGIPPEAAQYPAGTPAGLFVTRSPLDDRQRVVAFRLLRGTSLYAVGSVDIGTIMAPWYERLVLVVGMWLVLGTAALWFAYRLAVSAREHETLAAIDSLTGVLNRRSLLGLADSPERRRERGDRLVVMMVDVDHFKVINDTYGHAVGDEILCRIAAALHSCCRQSDLVGRYGGEEFLVVLDHASVDDSLLLAENMRQAVTAVSTPRGPVSVSIGIAAIDTVDGTLDDAIRRADTAMYAAKAAGRNCVMVADAAAPAVPAA
ncbi:MAG: diguanylate cyclase [Rhodocyclales bacterium]|nr:diguanylate cyclase [Rhodocyclales bacterium]